MIGSGLTEMFGDADTDTYRTEQVEIWDPAGAEWHQTTKLHTPRMLGAIGVLRDGCLIVAGGLGCIRSPVAPQRWERPLLSSVEIWNPESRSWRQTTKMTVGRSQMASCVLQSGKFVVMGGHAYGTRGVWGQSDDFSDAGEIYDPTSEEWSQLPDMIEDSDGPEECNNCGSYFLVSVAGGMIAIPEELFCTIRCDRRCPQLFDEFTNQW
jgi:hypothetical protein